ncbi:MAG: hypothetical protein R6V19_08265 [Armatimonadota bacterium]
MSDDTFEEARSVGRRLWDGLKRATTSASEAADRTLTITRLRSTIKKLKNQRRKIEKAIGEKVYQLHEKGKVRNADILQDCERIDDLRKRVEETEQRIEKLQAEEPEETEELEDDSFLTDEEEAEETATPIEVETPEAEEAPEEPDLTEGISLDDGEDERESDIEVTISTPTPEDESTQENAEKTSGDDDEDI